LWHSEKIAGLAARLKAVPEGFAPAGYFGQTDGNLKDIDIKGVVKELAV